jgi:predicted metal-dependent peptidase
MKNTTATKPTKTEELENFIGPTDPAIDANSREKIVVARVNLLLRHSFFGNLATRLQLVNADEWCQTAGTDGLKLYYNSRFIQKLNKKEVEFLVAHEVLHIVYDHFGRRGEREPRLWNIANDYAVNADLRKHKVGEFITSVPCLYDHKYENKSSEEIYQILYENADKIDINDLLDMLLDDHLDGDDSDDQSGNDKDGNDKKSGKGRPRLSAEEREQIRQELKSAIVTAAQTASAGSIPAGVERLVKEITNPTLNWRELLQTVLTSTVKNDYSWLRPSRRSWHIDAILPGLKPGEEIEVDVALDVSGSISDEQVKRFLGEIAGIMEAFDSYRIHVFSFDTSVYNPQDFTSENLDDINTYDPMGGGGTDFTVIFDHLKKNNRTPARLIVLTDGYPNGSWGDENYTDVTWIIHGNNSIVPPWGTYAYLED